MMRMLGFLFLAGCGEYQPLRFFGTNDAGAVLAKEAVESLNDKLGCRALAYERGRIRISDSGDVLTLFDDAPTPESPLDFAIFIMKTPTHDRKMAVLYQYIGKEFGLQPTDNSAMQPGYSWLHADETAESLTALMLEHAALPAECRRKGSK